ncbi:MAG: ABC transporter permease [Acidobacteriaceae bacterium]|nr:ABC transporter permease [Acidobacteriaceae bacterium]
MITELLTRLRFLVLRKKHSDMDDELQFHLDQSIKEKLAAGMTASEARRQAMIEFGGVERTREQCVRQRPGWFLDTFKRDVLHGLRMMRRSPGPMAIAVITLALGIGANTAIFSIVDGIWLRPLPIADPSHLVAISSVKNHAAADSEGLNTESSFAEFTDIRERVSAFADVAARDRRGFILHMPDGLQLLLAEVVSDNYFTFMGIRPELGHFPNENELRRVSTAPYVVISHGTWKRLFGGDPNVIGQIVNVAHGAATIAAVMPSEFRGTNPMIEPQVYIPQSSWYTWDPGGRNPSRVNRQYTLFARLRPGATLTQANEQMRALSENLAAAYPEANSGRALTANWQTKSVNDADGVQYETISIFLLAIAGAVLLIACTNIANILLALNDSRRREMAMRAALGASRGMLLRQLVTEYSVLAVFGVAGGVLLAERLILLIPALMPNVGFPLGFDFRLDHRVLAFAVAAGVVSVLICGLIPALAVTRTSPLDAMRTQLPQRGRLRMPARKIFVVAQMTISMALLIITGLLIRTLLHIENMDFGFNSRQNAVLMEIGVSSRQNQDFDAIVARMKALPGVKDASVARVVPFPDSGNGATKVVLAPDELPSETAGFPVWFNSVDNGYFGVMDIPLLRGRAFGRQDTAASGRVAIINEALAKKLFGDVDVVGRNLRLGRKDPVNVEIVGVTSDGKYSQLTETPQPYLYLPFSQEKWFNLTLIVTTAGDARALLPVVRKTMQQINPNTLISNSQTLTDHMRLVTYLNRMAAWLIASLGGLALFLAILGLYGVTAYAVSRRTHEIGIRMALGASRGEVFKSVMKDGLKLTLAGMVLGAGIALLLGRQMSSLLFGVKPFDPTILTGVAIVVIATSIAALIVPARRALGVDPMVALREE